MNTLIKNASHVLTLDESLGDLRDADILISGTKISQIGSNIAANGANVIDGTDMIVLPGFIDTHRHTWQSILRNIASDWTLAQYFAGLRNVMSPLYTPEDTYLANLIGALEALDSGITTLYDWCHNINSPEHADAAIRGLADSGIRAVFGYGNSAEEWVVVNDKPTNFDDLKRVQAQYFTSQDHLLTLAFAARGPQFATLKQTIRDFRLARELGLRITVHVGDGLWGMNGPLLQLQEHDLLRDDTTYVHCNTLQDAEFQLMADTGGTASIAPELEMHMGHGFPATLKLLEAGIKPSISIDIVTSIGGDMFGAMRALLAGTRSVVNGQALENRRIVDPLPLMCTDVLGFATIEGARACGLAHRTGSLTKGKEADLVLINAKSLNLFPLNNVYNAVVESCHVGNVDTVLIAGKVVKQKGRLVGVDIDKLKRRAENARDELYRKANIPVGKTWLPQPYEEGASVS